jgi:hypothetical protein
MLLHSCPRVIALRGSEMYALDVSHRILTVRPSVETLRSDLCTVSGGQVIGELMCVMVDAAAQLPKGHCSPWL